MSYKNKYLKYKLKYLNLKKNLRGGMETQYIERQIQDAEADITRMINSERTILDPEVFSSPKQNSLSHDDIYYKNLGLGELKPDEALIKTKEGSSRSRSKSKTPTKCKKGSSRSRSKSKTPTKGKKRKKNKNK